MADLILHHYPTSPFAEKVRLVLGYKNLAWKSVVIPQIMPKPDLQALTGGYRKTPVLQIGADIYCDTALIADAPGIITARQAEVGQVVQATVPIFSLARDGERDAVFNVYESLLVEPPWWKAPCLR